MEITLQELLEGKGTVIKNKEYYPTRNYVEPFIEKMSRFTDDFKIMVKLPDQMTTLSENLDKTYNRVWIQAKLPDTYSFDNHNQVIGFLYGLDVRKPVVKMYRGGLNSACTNLCVFNPSWLTVQEIEPESPFDYNPVKNLMETTDDLKMWIDKLKVDSFKRDFDLIDEKLGAWIRNAINYDHNNGVTQRVKLSTSDVISAYKELFYDDSSDYYVQKDEPVNMFKVYNAFTQQITNNESKDLMNGVEKTLLIKTILGI